MEKDIQKDSHIKVIQKRFNNIAAALYLVTNHLSDNEPLKTNIRETVHIVLEEILDISDMSGAFLDSRFGHIRNLLAIASIANLVSPQNVSLLDNEIADMQNQIIEFNNQNGNIAIDIREILSLGRDQGFLRVEKPFANNPSNSPIAGTIKGHRSIGLSGSAPMSINQNALGNSKILGQQQGQGNPSQGQVQRQNPYNNSANMGAVPEQNISSKKEGLSPRQNQIIKEVRAKGQLTIRDLVGKIQGCSEKTIQRELLSLVETGVLKKEGERRWSRYSMV